MHDHAFFYVYKSPDQTSGHIRKLQMAISFFLRSLSGYVWANMLYHLQGYPLNKTKQTLQDTPPHPSFPSLCVFEAVHKKI